jgi:glycosyltransferase involved in cell wall biosynthesis
MQKELSQVNYEVLTVPYWPRFTTMNNLACKVIPRLTPYKAESFSFYYNILMRGKLKQRIKEMDVISTHYWVDSRLISNLAHRLGVPSVFHILGGPYSKEFIEVDKSTMYIAVSQGTKDLINKTHNLQIQDVVTPGIPSELFDKDREIEDEKKIKRLLFVGRLQPSKGVYELLEIFIRLAKVRTDVSLTIVGDGDIMDRLKETIRRHKLQDRIELTGSIPYHDVFEHYRSSTVLVFPTKKEVFPLVSIEAMACGLPAVVSDIPSLRESTGSNAILVPFDDIDLWVEKLSMLLDDEALRRSLSDKGREWARQFEWEKMSRKYEAGLIKARSLFLESNK